MPVPDTCPACGSDDVLFHPKTGKLSCEACSAIHLVEAQSPADESTVSAITRICHELARAPHWLPAIEEKWPAPVAHEYRRIRMMLLEDRPNVGSIVWQLKDFGEVLLKLPTLILFRELYETAEQEDRRRLVADLLQKPLSMGDWARLGTTMAAAALLAPQLHTAPLAHLFRRKAGGQNAGTALSRALAELVAWRNDEIGHGAHRLDYGEYLRDLAYWIARLNGALAEHENVWDGYVLQAGTGLQGTTGRALTGWDALGRNSGQHDELHVSGTASGLHLCCPDGFRLQLSPYVAYRQCAQCDRTDLFFFDAYRGRDRKTGFLDYYRAHKSSSADHQESRIADDYRTLQLSRIAGAELLDDSRVQGDYARASIQKLLEECQLQARTITPDYLRDPLRRFIETHDRGIYWLKASGHVGKTTFVADLNAHPLYGALRTCAFYIKREYHSTPAQFADSLGKALTSAGVLDIAAAKKSLPELPLDALDTQSAFVSWLGELRNASTYTGKLLVCIDGLDELPAPDSERSIADYIPTNVALPEGMFVLLTSRPGGECPDWLPARLLDRLQVAGDVCTLEPDPVEDAGYRTLMRQYFYAHLRLKWEIDIDRSLSDTTIRRTAHPAAETVQQWTAFSADDRFRGHARFATGRISAGDAAALDRVLGVFEDYEELFRALLVKSEYRFLFFSYLVDTIESTHDWNASTGLPGGRQMLAHLLQNLVGTLADNVGDKVQRNRRGDGHEHEAFSGKNLDLAHRALLLLAAAEEAAQRDNSWRSQPQVWRGLPLALLASLLSEDRTETAGGDAVSNRLVFVLYTLKPVLRSDKSDTADDARFSLALDMAATIRTLYGSEMDGCHARLAAGFMETWKDRYHEITNDDAAGCYGRAMLMAHAACSGDEELQSMLPDCLPSLVNDSWLGLASRASAGGCTKDVLEWLDRIIEGQRIVLATPQAMHGFRSALYVLYVRNCRERAVAISRLGGRNSELRSTDQLLELRGEVLAWLRQHGKQHDGLDDGQDDGQHDSHMALYTELCELEQQLGYRHRRLAQTEAELDNAVRWLRNSRARAAEPLRMALSSHGPDAYRASYNVRMCLAYVRTNVEFAICARISRDWKTAARQADITGIPDGALRSELDALRMSASRFLEEGLTLLASLPPVEELAPDLAQLGARINQEKMRWAEMSVTQLEAGLADITALRQIPRDRRNVSYAQDLAARLSDVGRGYMTADDLPSALACFREATDVLRSTGEQNCASRVLLAQALGNEFAAGLTQLGRTPAEDPVPLSVLDDEDGVREVDDALASVLGLSSELDHVWQSIGREVKMDDWPQQWSDAYRAFQSNNASFLEMLTSGGA